LPSFTTAAGLKTSALCHFTVVFFIGQSNTKEESDFKIGLVSVFRNESKSMREIPVCEDLHDQIANIKASSTKFLSFIRLLFKATKKQKKPGITELFLRIKIL
jgi:hypothetical protein